jgi:hypothetical protein
MIAEGRRKKEEGRRKKINGFTGFLWGHGSAVSLPREGL